MTPLRKGVKGLSLSDTEVDRLFSNVPALMELSRNFLSEVLHYFYRDSSGALSYFFFSHRQMNSKLMCFFVFRFHGGQLSFP